MQCICFGFTTWMTGEFSLKIPWYLRKFRPDEFIENVENDDELHDDLDDDCSWCIDIVSIGINRHHRLPHRRNYTKINGNSTEKSQKRWTNDLFYLLLQKIELPIAHSQRFRLRFHCRLYGWIFQEYSVPVKLKNTTLVPLSIQLLVNKSLNIAIVAFKSSEGKYDDVSLRTSR